MDARPDAKYHEKPLEVMNRRPIGGRAYTEPEPVWRVNGDEREVVGKVRENVGYGIDTDNQYQSPNYFSYKFVQEDDRYRSIAIIVSWLCWIL